MKRLDLSAIRAYPKRVTTVIVIFAILAGVAGGCGDSGGEADSTSQTSTSDAPDRGGEAGIEDFGEEASGSDREAILTSFEAYLGALAEKDYAVACPYVSVYILRSLEQLIPRASRPEDCPSTLPTLLAPAAAKIARQQADGKITKVRVEGDRAYVVFEAPGAVLYQMTMVHEDGRWKVNSVVASVLVPTLEGRS